MCSELAPKPYLEFFHRTLVAELGALVTGANSGESMQTLRHTIEATENSRCSVRSD